jgi:hypothetical protein
MPARRVFVEQANGNDAEAVSQALTHTAENLFDVRVLKYPATQILKAVRDDEAVVFVPLQTCYVLDALGICEGTSEIDVALALARLVETVRWEASKQGIGEILFVCKEKSTIAFAERHGFERWMWDSEKEIGLFRMRVIR